MAVSISDRSGHAAFAPSTRIIDVEQNATGQLAALIREHTGILIKEKLLKYDGRVFFQRR